MERFEPAVSDYGRLEFPVFNSETITSATGCPITFNYLNRGNKPVCRLSLVWKTGGPDCPIAASKVMARSIRDGAKGFSNSRIDNILDFNGAYLTGTRTNDRIIVNVVALSHRLKPILPILKAIVSAPTFPSQRVNFVKELLADNQRLLDKKVDYIALGKIFQLILGADHPRARILTPEDFLGIKRRDIFSAFESEIKGTTPEIWLSGALDNEVIDAVRDLTAGLAIEPTDAKVNANRYEVHAPQKADIEVPQAKQAAVIMGKVVPDHPQSDLNLLRIAAMALGGHFRSRLNGTVREKLGLTYGIYSYISYNPDGAVCLINAQTSRENVDRLIAATQAEIERLITDPLSDEEILDVRRQIMSSLATMLDTPVMLMENYINLSTNGQDLSFMYDYEDKALNLKASDIVGIAERYLQPTDFSIAVAG